MPPQHKTNCQAEHCLNQRLMSFAPPLPEVAISKLPVSLASNRWAAVAFDDLADACEADGGAGELASWVQPLERID